MDQPQVTPLTWRVDRGRPDQDELAALAVVLHALAGRKAAGTEVAPLAPRTPRWCRQREPAAPYSAPGSWR
ncbi:acyl-CoA carboxylase subunit epsilon [Streptomyces sp. NPDC002644]